MLIPENKIVCGHAKTFDFATSCEYSKIYRYLPFFRMFQVCRTNENKLLGRSANKNKNSWYLISSFSYFLLNVAISFIIKRLLCLIKLLLK